MTTLTTTLIVLAMIVGIFLVYSVLSPTLMNFSRFLGHPRVFCPVHQEHGYLTLNSLVAAFTAGYGTPDVHVKGCTLLAPKESCAENCLKSIEF